MAYKLLFKIFFFFCFALSPINLHSNIVYDKNEIIITDIDLNYYRQLYLENFNQKLNKSEAIKNIVIIKNVINNFEKNNPEFIKRLDKVLKDDYGIETMSIKMIRDFMRYYKIKNEFIFEFYQTKFNIDDLREIFLSIGKVELPISNNNCLTILKLINFENNEDFLKNFYENLKKENKKYNTVIDDISYDVCIDSRTYKSFESKILSYIESETKNDFKKFVYEQQN